MGLALSLRNLKVDHLYSQTVPIMSAPQDPNRVVWTEDAKAVWAKFKEAKPLFGSDDSAGADKQEEEQSQVSVSEEPTEPAQTEDPSPQPSDDSGSSSQEEKPRLDEKTGLLVHPDGILTDPETGGVVDPDDGSIKDPNTNLLSLPQQHYLQSAGAQRRLKRRRGRPDGRPLRIPPDLVGP